MGEFGVVVEVKSVSLHTSSTDSNASCCPSFVECPVDISVTSTTRDAFMRGSQSCSALHSMWSHYNTAKKPALSVCNTTNSPTWTLEEQQKLRAHLSSRVNRRNASSRYAAKQLRKDLYLKKKTEAAKDLGREAKFLSCLHHPNIVSLRATVSRPGHADFMILLDYLSNPLSEQMVQWKEQEMTCANFLIPWQSQQQIQQQAAILSARLLALHDVAQGMRYLHQKL